MRLPEHIQRDIDKLVRRLEQLNRLAEARPDWGERLEKAMNSIEKGLTKLRAEFAASQSFVWPGAVMTDGDIDRVRRQVAQKREARTGPKRTRRERRARP